MLSPTLEPQTETNDLFFLLARSLAKSLLLTRLPELAQPYVFAADRLLQRFQKVKLFQPMSACFATARPVLVAKRSNPRGRDRTSNQLPRSKTNEG